MIHTDENVLEETEKEKYELMENLATQSKKIDLMQGDLSDLRTENTVLKNAAKQQKQYLHSDTQTGDASNQSGGVGMNRPKSAFGVQKDLVGKGVHIQADCKKCTEVSAGYGVDFGIDSSTQTDWEEPSGS